MQDKELNMAIPAACMDLKLISSIEQEHHTPIKSGLLGGLIVGVIGVLVPPTMFWGEYEIQTIADPSKGLPHIWPQGGVHGLEPFLGGHYSPGHCSAPFSACYLTFKVYNLGLVIVIHPQDSALKGKYKV